MCLPFQVTPVTLSTAFAAKFTRSAKSCGADLAHRLAARTELHLLHPREPNLQAAINHVLIFLTARPGQLDGSSLLDDNARNPQQRVQPRFWDQWLGPEGAGCLHLSSCRIWMAHRASSFGSL